MQMEDRFLSICSKKYEKGKADWDSLNFQKSGSTAAVVLIVGDTIHVANCGDSHVYLYAKKTKSLNSTRHKSLSLSVHPCRH